MVRKTMEIIRQRQQMRKNKMMTLRRQQRCLLPLLARLILSACLCLPTASWAAAGIVTHLGGVLNVTRADGTKKLLSIKSEVQQGDVLRTEQDTYARIRFTDGSEVVLRPETVFKIERYRFNAVPTEAKRDGFMMRLVKGGLRAVTGLIGKRDPSNVRMRAGTATIGIRGTHWGVMCVGEDTCKSDAGEAEDDAWLNERADGGVESHDPQESAADVAGSDNREAINESRMDVAAGNASQSALAEVENQQSGSEMK
ncbi:MAG TPA: hypothetical protein DFK12_07380 [Gallionellaceae bacterium]|nr:hypothetical protein [Gallionellaceae bacterium]